MAVNHLFDFVVGAVGEGVDDDVTLAVDEVEQDEEAFPEVAGGGMIVTVGTVGLPPATVPPPPSVTE